MSTIKNSIINAVQAEQSQNPQAASKPRQKGVAREFNYLDIKRSSTWSVSNNVFQWNCRQFALYILNSYKDKYKEDWNVKIVGVITHINPLKQAVYDYNGFCDNVVLKDYIDFYFNNWADYFKKNDPQRNNSLNFMTLKMKRPILDFSSVYNYSNRLKYYQNYNGLPSFCQTDMKKLYLTNITEFVKSYGFIIAVNFLMVEGINRKDSLKKVGAVMLKLRKDDLDGFNKTLIRTEELSPYPNELPFDNHNKFLNLLFKDEVLPVSVKYSFDSIDWEFLKGENNC